MGLVPSASYSVTVRLDVPADGLPASQLTAAVESVGGMVTAFDVTAAHGDRMQVDLTCAARDADGAELIADALAAVEGVVVSRVSDRTFLLHLGGKIEVRPKIALRTRDDLSMAYTPGVARVSMAIAKRPEDARRLTIKRNSVAVVTDGSAVLGLGNIGPAAALPVMEGKAALFKRFANIDAFPICLDTQDTEEIIRTVEIIAPAFGGINLEDIAAPRCFEIERTLRERLDIPVFHDDQHGTAIVVLGALTNALRVVDKSLADVCIVLSGAGAAGSAILDLLLAAGATDIVVGDIHGVVHAGRDGMDASLARIAERTNKRQLTGPLNAALAGADVFIGVSAPNVISEDDVASMASRSIVFALANPDPEIEPILARRHAEVVATGRSDFPNQINNVLAFPGVFRGLLDAQSRTIPVAALLAAAEALANVVTDEERVANYIVPSVFNPDLATNVATAVKRAVEDADAVAERPAPGVLAAAQFLTRVPIRTTQPPDLAAAVIWFPVVGAVIGAAVGGVAAGLSELVPAGVAAAVAILFGVLVTGAFHEDGLADTADAVAGGWTVERRLQILDDPRHGTYGVAALCGSIVLRVVAVASLAPAAAFAGLVAAHALGRGAAVTVMGVAPAAGPDGLGADYARAVGTSRAMSAGAVAVVLAAASTGWWAVPLAAAAAVAAVIVTVVAGRAFGGISGDVLGAVEQVAECAVLVVVSGLAVRSDVWWSSG